MQPRLDTGFFGLDISSLQTITDAALLFSKVDYMIFRAYGTNHTSGGDTSFLNYVSLAKQYGCPSGAYYFATPFVDANVSTDAQIIANAQEQAQQFIDKLQEAYGVGQYGEIMPLLDIEAYSDNYTQHGHTSTGLADYPKASGMTGAQLLTFIKAFRDYFRSTTGRAIAFYSNRYFMQDATQMGMTDAQLMEISDMPLWLAEYDRWYPNNATNGPSTWAGWTEYNLWQYEVIADSLDYGITSNLNEVDHNYTNDMSLILVPKVPYNETITQLSNSKIRVTFTRPNDIDYAGADIYLDGVYQVTVPPERNYVELDVTTLVGQQLQINVVTKDTWGDVTWGANTYYTMVEMAVVVPPYVPSKQKFYDYSDQEIKDMLHAKHGSRFIRFRYDLLDKNEKKIRTLTNVLSGEVSMNAFNTVKRTAKFSIREDENEPIDYLSHRIQPFVELKMPDQFEQNSAGVRTLVEGKWIEYPLGVFILSSPTKKEQGDFIYRDIEAYDKLVILQEDKYTDRTIFKKGTRYVDAVISVLLSAGITKYNILSNENVLGEDMEYEPGTEKYKPIADFLNAINYNPLNVDEYGYVTSQPYVSPQVKSPDYRYELDEFSVVAHGMEEELDLYAVPNVWVAYYSNADSVGANNPNPVTLRSVYTNSNPDSPTSTVSRGRNIVDYRKVEEIADQIALNAYVQRIAFEASQIYGKVKFQTAIMPFHGFQNVLYLRNPTLGIDGKYAETSWKITLKSGALMDHEVRAVINV